MQLLSQFIAAQNDHRIIIPMIPMFYKFKNRKNVQVLSKKVKIGIG